MNVFSLRLGKLDVCTIVSCNNHFFFATSMIVDGHLADECADIECFVDNKPHDVDGNPYQLYCRNDEGRVGDCECNKGEKCTGKLQTSVGKLSPF